VRRLTAASAATAAAALLMTSPAMAADVAVRGLEADAATTPLGIDDATPELRWQLESALRGVAQTKYRVVVATTAAKATAGDGDVWDTGDVASAATSVTYSGPALTPRTRYYWSVRSSTGAGASDWATATWFETAYLSPSEWKGTWISGPARTPGLLTDSQAFADDACCSVADTALVRDAAAGATNVKVASIAAIQVGKSLTVGSETVTVKSVGTGASSTTLEAAAAAGATSFTVPSRAEVAVGDELRLDTGAAAEDVTVASVTRGGRRDPLTIGVTVPLSKAHEEGAAVSNAGTGVELQAPLASAHASDTAVKGTGTPTDFCRPVNGSPASGGCKEVRPAPYLRRAFDVAPVSEHGAVVSARVYSSGLGWTEMTLNGARTEPNGFLNPGFTSYDKTVLYTTDDVTSLIEQNASAATENVIASQLGSGRYDSEATSGNHGWERAEFRANPTLRADLYVKYADGTEQLVKSDDSWKTSDGGPIRYDNFDLGETYDATKAIANWDKPGFDAAAWSAARTVTGPAGVARAQKQDLTRKVADWPAGTRSEPSPRVYVWDTGQQRTGWATIAVHGAPKGTPIQIRYAEKLGSDGLVSISGYAPAGQIQTDYYIADGTGTAARPETFAPRFTFNGYQYVQISGVGGAPLPEGVTASVESAQEVRTDMRPTGTFTSSSSLLNMIEHATRASVAGVHEAGYVMDTPTYEKDGWTGDTQLVAPTASLMFDTQRQYEKTAQDLVDDQLDNGEISLLTPGNRNYGYSDNGTFKPANGGSTPVWDALLFVAPWEAYQRYDDPKPLATAYAAMKKYLNVWIPRWFAADGDSYDFTLTSGLGDWDPPTGADAPDGSPTDVRIPTVIAPSSTAYVAYMAKITADAARALGKAGEAAELDTLFGNIKADYNAKWWDASVGHYREDATQILAQTAQALPLEVGLVPADKRRGLQEQLVNDVLVTRAGHEMVGIAGSRWIFPALTQAAREGVPDAAKAAYTIALQTTYPSYGRWVLPPSQGGLGWTGLGEYWEASSRTRNHEMFGSIGQWMYEDLAGIQPLEPGYGRISIRPLIADYGIGTVSATYDSVRGPIKSSWTQSTAGIRLDVTIPANTTAKVYVPGTDPAKIGEVGSGTALPAKNAPGVTVAGVDQGSTVLEVGSGSYSFVVGPGLFNSAEATGTVGGTVPPTLSLTLGAPASFGPFAPGVEKTYEASTSATVTSTAGDAALTVSDPGHLSNGSFTLRDPLQVSFSKARWTAPVSNDPVTLAFEQHVGANDPLRTGTYSRTLTFTLSTTNP
jgi:alpha-L-rhamnosidase